jgi:tubulin--tyrosine ligase
MRVLLVNDDGPPSITSPHVLGLWEMLRSEMKWDVSVVLPSSGKSWGGMAYSISGPVSIWYYYPLKGNYDGQMKDTPHSWSSERRPVGEHEVGEWVLLDGVSNMHQGMGM